MTRAKDLIAEARPVEWVVERLLPAANVIIAAGLPKRARKTYAMMALCLAVCRGADFCGLATRKRKVLYVFLEDGRGRVARRLKQFGQTATDDIDFFTAFDTRDVDALLEAVRANPDPMLVVIDPLVILERHRQVRDENTALEIEGLFASLREVAQASGSTIVLVHHYRKAGDTMRGSIALQGSSDGWWDMKPWGKGKLIRLHSTLRDAEDEEIAFEMVTTTDGTLVFEPREVPREAGGERAQATVEAIQGRIADHLRTATTPQSQAEIAKAIGHTRSAVQKALRALEAANGVQRKGKKGGYVVSGAAPGPGR